MRVQASNLERTPRFLRETTEIVVAPSISAARTTSALDTACLHRGIRRDDPEFASYLQIEERELEAGL